MNNNIPSNIIIYLIGSRFSLNKLIQKISNVIIPITAMNLPMEFIIFLFFSFGHCDHLHLCIFIIIAEFFKKI